jgi:tRNA-dihydrouridine synthase
MRKLKPIKLKNILFNSPIIQGPLAGYSCSAFRDLIWQYSSPAFCYTEMLPAQQLCNENGLINRFTHKSKYEGFLCYQLSGNNPSILAHATSLAINLGADCIDLNAGCPKKKIRKKGHGSAILEDVELLYKCLVAMRNITNKPIILKMRIDIDIFKSIDVVNAAHQANIDAIVVHGRSWKDDYNINCQWEKVALLPKHKPIIINGDLDNIESINRALEISSTHHIMISRASMGQPNLINSILNNTKIENNLYKSSHWLLQHLTKLEKISNKQLTFLQSRSIVRYYAKKLSNTEAKTLTDIVFKAKDLNEILTSLSKNTLNLY